MNYLPSNLSFEDGVAHIGDTSLLDVAKEYGTPLYVYDWEHLKNKPSSRRCRVLLPATSDGGH